MKITFRLAVAAIALAFVSTVAQAQQKFGYINSQELISVMPESAEANNRLEELSVELSTQFQSMQTELVNKAQDLNSNIANLSEAVRRQREQELNDLSNRIEEFQQTAQQELQSRQMELFRPVVEKAQQAIEKVGQEQGLVCVFDLATGALAWYNESQMINIMPLVQRELGI